MKNSNIRKDTVTVEVDKDTLKALMGVQHAMSELASAFISGTDKPKR